MDIFNVGDIPLIESEHDSKSDKYRLVMNNAYAASRVASALSEHAVSFKVKANVGPVSTEWSFEFKGAAGAHAVRTVSA